MGAIWKRCTLCALAAAPRFYWTNTTAISLPKSALLTLLSHSWKIKNKTQWSNLVPTALSLFIRERTLVVAGHVEMCVNKLRSGGRSCTKFCRLDDEKLFWLGEILAWKWRFSFWVGCKLCCFRLVTITLFWRQNRILFREFVLEKRFGRRPASRIRKIYLDLQVQNQLFLNFAYSTRAVQFMKEKR